MKLLTNAAKKFIQIDGVQWAGAFAYNAFFSLFPLLILFVTVTSLFIDRYKAGLTVINFMGMYIPITAEIQAQIFTTISGVVYARGLASIIALFILLWAAIQCFITLVDVTNRAWGTAFNHWWRLPLRSLLLLCLLAGIVLLGVSVPPLLRIADIGNIAIPWAIEFVSLSLFYKLAPHRETRFSEVWFGALCATILLQLGQSGFIFYLKNFATLNLIYGAFGGIMALLLWIYLSGCIFIFGACLCAVRHDAKNK